MTLQYSVQMAVTVLKRSMQNCDEAHDDDCCKICFVIEQLNRTLSRDE